LFEISTDKVDAEIPSPSAGVLKEIKVGEGQTVPIQTIVGVIDVAGSAAASSASAPAKAAAPVPGPAKPAATGPAQVASRPAGSCTGHRAGCGFSRSQVPRASGFIVPRSFGAWPRSTGSISPPSKARVRAGASASRIRSGDRSRRRSTAAPPAYSARVSGAEFAAGASSIAGPAGSFRRAGARGAGDSRAPRKDVLRQTTKCSP